MNADARDHLVRTLKAYRSATEEAVAKQRLTIKEKALSDTFSVTRLAAEVNDLAAQEAAYLTYHQAALIAENNADFDWNNWLLEQLTYGADDQWSGRTGDVRRSAYDGRAAAIGKIHSVVRFTQKSENFPEKA